MNKRKETPDVLSEILGGEISAPVSNESPPPAAKEKPKPASKTRKTATSPRRKKTPTKWAYRVVSFQEYRGWRPRYLDGKAIKDWTEGPLMLEYIASMGEQGWELATACSGDKLFGRNDKYQLYFKRPK